GVLAVRGHRRPRLLGSSDLFNASTGTALSQTVSNLPRNGATLYVRLYSLAGPWQYRDYTYFAFSVNIGKITNPTPGGQVLGTTTVFTWSPGSGVLQYGVYVGKSQGASDIFDSGGSLGTATSLTVNGIPTASCTAPPTVTSASTLPGASGTVTWSDTC